VYTNICGMSVPGLRRIPARLPKKR
jgi:hypothetical protein